MFDPNHEDIRRARQAVDQRRAECEKARKEFLKELGSALEEWIPEVIRKYATTDQREHTTTIGVEKVKAMQADLAQVAAGAKDRVNEWLADDDLWAHRDTSDDVTRRAQNYTPSPTKDSAPDPIDRPVRQGLVDLLFPLLERYGYRTSDAAGRRSYGGSFSFKGKPNNALRSYGETIDKLYQAEQALEQTIKKLEVEAAAALWDGTKK